MDSVLLHHTDRAYQSKATDANGRTETLLWPYRLCEATSERARTPTRTLHWFSWNSTFQKLDGSYVSAAVVVSSFRFALNPSLSNRFLSYEIIQRGLNKYKPELSPGTVNFLSGGMASNFFWVAAFPFDAVKK